MAVGTKTLHGSKRVPQWNHIGSTVQYRGEAHHTYINHHVGTLKQKETSYLTVLLD